MITNADITLFNKSYDRENRQDIFLPTVIKGVSLYMKQGSTGDNKFRESSATYKIRIPVDADMGDSTYVDLVAYRKMDLQEASKHWTLQPDSVVIPLVVDESVVEQRASLTELTKKYGTFITVTDFSDNTTRGIRRMHHWRIGGI